MNTRKLCTVIAAGLLFLILSGGRPSEALQDKSDARAKENEAKKKPIAPANSSETDNLLRRWYASGSAAGNAGDYYDNRDGGHSSLNLSRHPQLLQTGSSGTGRTGGGWGRQTQVLPYVVIGNSSTSFSASSGGSNPRGSYVNAQGINILYRQYTGSNLYVYPEHQDYDPGHNGTGGGYGDLFPINTPYLIISQGSSGSDQEFLRAVAYTLAAFRPQVKQKLKESGHLMPVIQMLLRISGRRIETDTDYLTGRAHPVVFQGNEINARKMIEMAHDIALSNLPPIARIRVAEEDEAVLGRDYFEPGRNEKLADTPAAIGRIFRSSSQTRKIIIDASESSDLNGKPLKYFWRVLQGDPDSVNIEYLNREQSIAEITVRHFHRFTVEGKPRLGTNRVDIGVFVHNGTYYSPPAFLTFHTSDSEDRTYTSDGRIVDIGYNAGTASISVTDWAMLLRILKNDGSNGAERLLRDRFSAEELSAIGTISDEFTQADADAVSAKIKYDAADAAQKAQETEKGKAAVNAARKAYDEARNVGERVLEKQLPKLGTTTAALVQRTLNELLTDADFSFKNADVLKPLEMSVDRRNMTEFTTIRESLTSFGILRKTADGFELNPVAAAGSVSFSEQTTRFGKRQIARLNAALLARAVFPRMLRDEWRVNYIDTRLDTLKEWRDVYNYAPDGTLLGWTRYLKDGTEEYNAEGLLIMEKDALGRTLKARPVRYVKTSNTIKATPAGEIQTYSW